MFKRILASRSAYHAATPYEAGFSPAPWSEVCTNSVAQILTQSEVAMWKGSVHRSAVSVYLEDY